MITAIPLKSTPTENEKLVFYNQNVIPYTSSSNKGIVKEQTKQETKSRQLFKAALVLRIFYTLFLIKEAHTHTHTHTHTSKTKISVHD